MTTQASAEALAEWLAKNEPALFDALLRQAATDSARLNGITDFLSSIGNAVTGAAKSVGTYLTSQQGMNTLTNLGTSYLAGKQQQKVLSTQVALAQAGMSPAPIQNTIGANGQTVPIYTPTQQVATNQVLYQLQPSFFEQYKTPLLVGGALALVLLIASR